MNRHSTCNSCNDHVHGKAKPAVIKDPVCKMTVDPKKTAHQLSYNGQDYFFCSASCQKKFQDDPAKYAGEGASASHSSPAPTSSGSHTPTHTHTRTSEKWTCPMHPEILKDEPGSCTLRFETRGLEIAPSAAWRWKPLRLPRRRRRVKSWQ